MQSNFPEQSSRWEQFPHAADVGVRGFGATPAQAFEQAALAMMAIITDPACIQPRDAVDIECRAPDLELLLCDWLNALIYEMAVRHRLFSKFEVRIQGESLRATAWGEPIDAGRHQPAVEPKGATFTELFVGADGPDRWRAQCVVDV